jgi:hypothetical protein
MSGWKVFYYESVYKIKMLEDRVMADNCDDAFKKASEKHVHIHSVERIGKKPCQG